MQQFGQYVISLTAAGMIRGILLSLLQDGILKNCVRLLCSVFLICTALSPLVRVSIPDSFIFSGKYLEQGYAAAAAGESQAEKERTAYINEKLESYIRDKAKEKGITITPELILDHTGNPVSITIAGNISVEQKRWIQETITNDLGIPKENQQWMG